MGNSLKFELNSLSFSPDLPQEVDWMKYCMPFVFFYEMEARKFIALGTGGIPFVMAAIFFWELFDRPS